MFHLLNTIANANQVTERWHQLTKVVDLCWKATWKSITSEKTQRILRAIRVALWVLGTIVLAGLWEVGKLAMQEAIVAFQKQVASEETENLEPQTIQDVETLTPDVHPVEIAPPIGVRELRQIATHRGIQNAGRMRKPELLAVLNVVGEASALGK